MGWRGLDILWELKTEGLVIHKVDVREVQGGLEERDSAPLSLRLLPLHPHVALLFPEWSVSTGSAQDEMSYLRLILIS